MNTRTISTRYNQETIVNQLQVTDTAARYFKLFSFVLILLLTPMLSHAVDIRGRVDRINPLTKKPVPYSNANVTLQQKDKTIRRTRTGRNGIYYMQNLNHGQYKIKVNNQKGIPITLRNTNSQDINPILVR